MRAADTPAIKHSFFATGGETRIVDGDGKVVWRYPGSTRDGQVLPDGNILLAVSKGKDFPGGGVVEITRDQKVLFSFKGTQAEVNTAQKLANGNIMLTEAGPNPRIIEVNREKERVSLGLKQTTKNPWDEIDRKFPVGAKVKGKVVNLVAYGAFIELEPGVEGLVHVTELSWTKRIAKPSDVLKQGQEVDAVVLGINREEQKISLGIRQLETNPWDLALAKYPVGTKVKGKVTKLASFGAFIGLQHDIDGLVHISQISEERVDKIKNVLNVGQEVTARVVKIDRGERRIGLSIKAANYSPEQLKEEQKMLDQLKPGEDLVALAWLTKEEKGVRVQRLGVGRHRDADRADAVRGPGDADAVVVVGVDQLQGVALAVAGDRAEHRAQ